MKAYKGSILALLFGVFFIAGTSAHAASLYIDPPFSELYRGDAVELSIRLNVDKSTGECINAVDAVLSYSTNIAPVDISLGDSIFSMWVQEPVIDTQERTISFAGGIPNGYCGRVDGDPRLTNTLATMIFRSPGFSIGGGGDDGGDSTKGNVIFTDFTTAYLNDGLGTKADLATYGAEITLNKKAGPGIVDPWRDAVGQDQIPPEEFSIFLEKDPLAFSGKYYISFNTTDKQTGIDQYQVIEQPLNEFGSFTWGEATAPWVVARSPYVLEDQSLNTIIRVKAIDKAGNEYIATLLPEESLRTLSRNQATSFVAFGVIGIILLICFAVLGSVLFKKIRKRKTAPEESEDDEELKSEQIDETELYENE